MKFDMNNYDSKPFMNCLLGLSTGVVRLSLHFGEILCTCSREKIDFQVVSVKLCCNTYDELRESSFRAKADDKSRSAQATGAKLLVLQLLAVLNGRHCFCKLVKLLEKFGKDVQMTK